MLSRKLIVSVSICTFSIVATPTYIGAATSSHVYSPGIHKVTNPSAPANLESSEYVNSGLAEMSVSNPNTTDINRFEHQIIYKQSNIRVNGIQYNIPTVVKNQFTYILPIDRGIIWIPVDRRTDEPTIEFIKKVNDIGNVSIYYTPYLKYSGSLADGEQTIATLPRRWLGQQEAVFTSAWTGWLPQNTVVQPKRDHLQFTAMLTNDIGDKAEQAIQLPASASSDPIAFETTVPTMPKSDKPLFASIGQITRTTGGFILDVSLHWNPQIGQNWGVRDADYYWSETTHKWTPLTQGKNVQTLNSHLYVGSEAAYWIHPFAPPLSSAVPKTWSANLTFGVGEYYFDPATITIRSIWLGNWFYGGSFVDGKTWIVKLADTPANSNVWTTYTP